MVTVKAKFSFGSCRAVTVYLYSPEPAKMVVNLAPGDGPQPSAETAVGLPPERPHREGHGPKHLLAHVGGVGRLKPGPPAPGVDQRSVELHELPPRLGLPGLESIQERGGDAGGGRDRVSLTAGCPRQSPRVQKRPRTSAILYHPSVETQAPGTRLRHVDCRHRPLSTCSSGPLYGAGGST